ncbi:MAG: hypothetical protein K2P59_05625, partial [Acetatifactor sp.]|nr:hypothetical protein [Acetatifactor sp.]
SMTSLAAELPQQQTEESVSVASITGQIYEDPAFVNKTCYVRGNGVRLRRDPGTSGDVLGELYENAGDWVTLTGQYTLESGYKWMEVSNSSIGMKGWIAINYIKY